MKAMEARNVRVALATDGFNPYGMMTAPYSCWPMFIIPLSPPPGVMFVGAYQRHLATTPEDANLG